MTKTPEELTKEWKAGKPDDEIDFGERYCTICGCVLRSNEEQICDECFFESSKPLTDEEIKVLEGQER